MDLEDIVFKEHIAPLLPMQFNSYITHLLSLKSITGLTIKLPNNIFKENTANTIEDLEGLAIYIYNALRAKYDKLSGINTLDFNKQLLDVKYRFIEEYKPDSDESNTILKITGIYNIKKENLWEKMIRLIKIH